MSPDEIDTIAAVVSERIRRSGLGLVTVEQLARELCVERAWVYERWRELGGRKLGPSRNAPIRFDLERVRSIIERDGLREGRSAPAPAIGTPRASSRRVISEGTNLLAPRPLPE